MGCCPAAGCMVVVYADAQRRAPGSDPSRVTSGQNPDVMDVMDVMVTSSRKWVTSSPPESHPESHPVKNGGPPALQSRS